MTPIVGGPVLGEIRTPLLQSSRSPGAEMVQDALDDLRVIDE